MTDEDPDTESTGIVRLKGFTLLPRSEQDIRIIRNPPWWTPAKVISASALLLVLLLAGLVWNFILQKLVARKGRELARESLAHLKAASALKITVRDNGRGFDPASRPGPAEGHFGLLGIQERLDRLDGTLDINSTPGHGAEFTITVES